MLILTFTGSDLDKVQLLSYCKSIKKLRVDGPLTNETNILISNVGGRSEKFQAALKIGLPIVKPDWIEYLYNNPSIDPESEESRSFMKSCLVHECSGWVISTTGFTPKEQALLVARIKELGEALLYSIHRDFNPLPFHSVGATYAASLTNEATCLIVKDLSSSSAKLKAAKKWGTIQIHDRNWLFGAFPSNVLIPHQSIDDSRKCSMNLLQDSDYSVSILVQQSSFNQSQTQPLSLVSRHEYKIPQQEPDRLIENNHTEMKNENEENLFLDQNLNDPSEESLYLDGCFIYLGEGFSDDLVTHLRKIVRDSGGNLMNQCSDIVTHFLVSGTAVTLIDAEKINHDMHVVSYKWLSECYLQKKQLDPFQYLVDREPLSKKEKKNPESSLNPLKQKNVMLKQAPPMKLKMVSSAETRKDQEMTLKSKKGSIEKKDDRVIFSGYFFSVLGFHKQENEIISKFIDELGGKVMLVSHLEDMLQKQEIYPEDAYLVKPFKQITPIPIIKENSILDKVQSVTEFFIEKCIQDLTLHPPSKLCLFQPSSKQFPIPEFSSVIVGTTGLTDEDKQWAERIISVLGGKLTHSFSRTNTHLLYNPSVDMIGPKFEKSREWGIPLVEMDWLYACIENGCVVPLKKQQDGGKKDLSLRSTKAVKLFQKSTMKTAKLFSERVYQGVSSTIQNVEESNNQIIDKIGEKQSIMQPRSAVQSPNPTEKDAEYASLLKTTIEETLAHLASKHASISSKVTAIPAKRRIIQESYDEIDQPKKSKQALSQAEKSPNQVTYIDADAKDEQMRLLQALAPAQPKFFMFSGINADSRPGLAETIKSLSGHVLEMETWDSKCTHLLISKVIKTEKFLAACASCAWYIFNHGTRNNPFMIIRILKIDYIQESKTLNKWLDETKFIIQGNEFTDAAMHWKRQFIDTGKKPFSGWKCCLSIEKPRKAGFERLLNAGGAYLVESIDEMFTSEDEKCYFFFDKLSLEEQTEIKNIHPTLKLRESTLIVEYLLSAGAIRVD